MYSPDGSFLMVGKALISAPLICWKGADLERRERQELHRRNKQACLFVSSMQACLWFPGLQCMGVNKMAAMWSVGNCDGRIVSHEHAHTQYTSLTDSLSGGIESRVQRGQVKAGFFPIPLFSVYDWHITFNERYILPLSLSVHPLTLWHCEWSLQFTPTWRVVQPRLCDLISLLESDT